MWFIFPQLRGLGRSPMAERFGIADLEEAGQYLADPVLGPRLVGICRALLGQPDRDVVAVFGAVDAQKLQSCATLFARVPGADPVFAEILQAFFGGRVCARTIAAEG
jgi:uncharacterized protein (DUF1810 family)